MIRDYLFTVKTIEAGQRGAYQDSYYHYEIGSTLQPYVIHSFCKAVLGMSYKREDMPNPFAGELIEFKSIGENLYSYKYKTIYND